MKLGTDQNQPHFAIAPEGKYYKHWYLIFFFGFHEKLDKYSNGYTKK